MDNKRKQLTTIKLYLTSRIDVTSKRLFNGHQCVFVLGYIFPQNETVRVLCAILKCAILKHVTNWHGVPF